MKALSLGIDLLTATVGALAWGFAVFAFGARWFSPMASGLLGLGVTLSGLVMVLAMHLRDRRIAALARGSCPRCHAAVAHEHRHRRWDPARREWLAPATTWDCPRCAFAHSEAWACPACPE